MEHARYELAFEQLPGAVRTRVTSAVEFVDLGEESSDFARLLLFAPLPDGGLLSLRGISLDGQLVGILALYESRRIFGARAAERFSPSASLFALGFARFRAAR